MLGQLMEYCMVVVGGFVYLVQGEIIGLFIIIAMVISMMIGLVISKCLHDDWFFSHKQVYKFISTGRE